MQHLDRLRKRMQIADGMAGQRLRLELVRQYQVRRTDEGLVHGHDVRGDVEAALVAHDGVEDPEERARVRGGLRAETACDFANGRHRFRGGGVAGQQHGEVG